MNCKHAFTLPEILITLFLLGILISISLSLTTSTNQAKKLRDYSIAVSLAQQAIEIIRAAPFELLDDKDSSENSLEHNFNTNEALNDSFGSKFLSNGISYTRKVTISDVMSAEDENLPARVKHVKVSVEWQGPDGIYSHPFTVSTLVADQN